VVVLKVVVEVGIAAVAVAGQEAEEVVEEEAGEDTKRLIIPGTKPAGS